MSPVHYRIVGTAGHIDHGKSALVRALTGVDPDRLREEKERGITIDLGFADARLGDHHVAFVDVPGHERFVKNMLAGIGGIDAVLLVVAADESIMPQTREHLAICDLLGIGAGVVAITKADLVDPEIAELVELEVSELLESTPLAGSPAVHTSVATGAGLEELRAELGRVLDETGARPTDGLLRLPVDRVFTMRGFGTVVTGTLLSGRVARGDRVEILPGGLTATVRGVQVHGQDTEAAAAGQRTALNLQGVAVDEVERGMTVAAPGTLEASSMIAARLHALPDHEGFEHLQRVRFHHGAAEVLGRIAILDGETIEPGGSGLVQLRLESAYPAVPGDRFVVRRYSPVVTIGGGVVLDRSPARARRGEATRRRLREIESADPDQRIRILVADAGVAGVPVADLAARLGVPRERVEAALDRAAAAGEVERDAAGRALAAETLTPLRARAEAALEAHHRRYPLRPAMAKEDLRAVLEPSPPPAVLDALLAPLVDAGRIRAEADGFALAVHVPRLDGATRDTRDRILERYRAEGLTPPAPDEVLAAAGAAEAREVLHFLLRAGDLVRIKDDLVLHAEALDRLIAGLSERFARGEQFSVADFRDWAGVTRKHAIPLLEHLDSRRVTRRVGDNRERI